MSAMHQDTSSDLRVVDEKLKNILEVIYFPCSPFGKELSGLSALRWITASFETP